VCAGGVCGVWTRSCRACGGRTPTLGSTLGPTPTDRTGHGQTPADSAVHACSLRSAHCCLASVQRRDDRIALKSEPVVSWLVRELRTDKRL
jgi:hypothetical protein